jgi:hypothetical protein
MIRKEICGFFIFLFNYDLRCHTLAFTSVRVADCPAFGVAIGLVLVGAGPI